MNDRLAGFRTLRWVLLLGIVLGAPPAALAGHCGVDVACMIAESVAPVATAVGDVEEDINHLDDDVVALWNDLGELWDGIDTVAATFDTITGNAEQVVARFRGLLDATSAETMALFSDPAQADVAESLLRWLEDGRQVLDTQFAEQADRYAEFVGDGGCGATCDLFRSRVAALVRELGRTAEEANAVLAAQLTAEGLAPLPPVPAFDYGWLADRIERAPAAFLFPLYVALDTAGPPGAPPPDTGGVFPGGCSEAYCRTLAPLAQLLLQVRGRLAALASLVPDAVPDHPRYLLCTALLAEPGVADTVGTVAAAANLGAKLALALSAKLEAIGLSVIDGDVKGGASVAMSMAVAVNRRPVRTFGAALRWFAKPIEMLGVVVGARTTDCRNRLHQYLVLCTLKRGVQNNSAFEECRNDVLFSNERFGF